MSDSFPIFQPPQVRRFREMTPVEWETLDVRTLLDYLCWRDAKGYDRKFILFACGCVRLGWRTLNREASRRALLVGEERAEGISIDPNEAQRIEERARNVSIVKSNPYAVLAYIVCGHTPGLGYYAATAAYDSSLPIPDAVQRAVAGDVFPNPLRPVTLLPLWLTSAVIPGSPDVREP